MEDERISFHLFFLYFSSTNVHECSNRQINSAKLSRKFTNYRCADVSYDCGPLQRRLRPQMQTATSKPRSACE